MPLNKDIKKVMVIGSGPIVIGQAAEFDYAGAQACRVLRDEGLDIVLVNSNPATIMTDKKMADAIYLEPLTAETVKRIIEKEKPDSILPSLGGQTGLTIAMQLSKEGYLDKMGVKLLGTNEEAIIKAEDRELFKETMDSINQPCIPSDIATDVERCLEIADEIGYPVIVRPAFTLGGAGGGVAYNKDELRSIASNGLLLSPITQVLIEKYIFGWKEIEFEVIRDSKGTAITVCSMENVDPVGVHTGDSIVVAPAVSLSTKEYNMLKSAALNIISALEIEGGCNCQFALNPETFEYAVIEVNPRVSRSSALASKATGFPIAKVSSKIALGYTLDEIRNDVTGVTYACFEPAIDYIVVKMPKWPFDKFAYAKRTLGTQMKATGEVMSIGPTFEMAIMKAVRGAEIKIDTLNLPAFNNHENIEQQLHQMDDRRLFAIFEALKQGVSTEKIHEITMVDEWFIEKLKNLVNFEKEIVNNLTEELYLKGKTLGYTDAALERISGQAVKNHKPSVYKMVDTCAGEFKAQTPYFYSSHDYDCEARESASDKKKIIVLGSGPIRIGQGIEFDYSSVHCVWTLKELGYEVIIINNNPETVSTDFDTADRLYFEPLTPEDVMNVIEIEKPVGVVVAFGGQTAINLTKFLSQNNIPILGTSAEGIDLAEDREQFDALLEKFDIKRPKGLTAMSLDDALKCANELGYPVLLRPSYVIGGQNMTIAHNDEDVTKYMNIILGGKIENAVLIDRYMKGTELEVDVISDGCDVLIPGVMQHVERAGIHSGDSIAVYPPYSLSDKMLKTIVDSSTTLALSLGTKGLVNIQYLIYDGELYVIEVNPRASRTIPYISKVTGIPMVDVASKVMLGQTIKELGYKPGLYKTPPCFAIKVPVFSFEKLSDINSKLGPEMKSTGEVLGIGKTFNEAMFKGLTSAGLTVQTHEPKGVFISVDEHDYNDVIGLAKKFDDLKIKIYSTKGTAEEIERLGIDVTKFDDISDNAILDLIDKEEIDYIIYTGEAKDDSLDHYIALHRRALLAGIVCMTSIDTANALADIIASRFNQSNTELIDINKMREKRQELKFSKMACSGNDFIFIDNRNGEITSPESLCIQLCDRHYGVGGYGIVLIENSKIADAKMRIFNRDGSEGKMAGNSIMCVGKFLYDNGYVNKTAITIETGAGVKELYLHLRDDKVSSVRVNMGKVNLDAKSLPVELGKEQVIGEKTKIGDDEYEITCVSVGNPHCVVFDDFIDRLDLKKIGPVFEHAPIFPDRVNTEFVRYVNKRTLKVRVWERGIGETMACGTGACAAVVAAVLKGHCKQDRDICVKLKGGDLIVNYSADGTVYLTGNADLIFEGHLSY